MRQNVFVGRMLLLATTLSLTPGLGVSARGGAAAAPHMAAAPHIAAAPRMSAPMHMAAPRMSAPMHMAAPHMSAPMHMAAPHMAPPHMAPVHMGGAERMPERSHMAEPGHMPGAEHEREGARGAENGRMNEGQRGGQNMNVHMNEHMNGAEHMRSGEGGRLNDMGAESGHGRNNLEGEHPSFGSHSAPITSSSPARLQSEHEDALRHLEDGAGPRAMRGEAGRGGMPFGRTAATVAGAAAVGGLAAHHMATAGDPSSMERGANERGGMERGGLQHGPMEGNGAAHKAQIRSDVQGAKGTRGTRNVPPAAGFANPRSFTARGGESRFDQKEPGQRLSYKEGAGVFPRGGAKGKGVPGVYDPGGYIRTPQSADTSINQNYARQQFANQHDWQGAMALNGHNVISNRGAWPWQLPAQSTWWNPFSWAAGGIGGGYPYGGYNPYWGNPYAAFNPYFGYPYGVMGDPYFWNNWNTFADWNNWNDQYANVDPGYWGNSGLFGMLGDMFGGPAGVGVGSGNPNDWLSNLLYFNAYSINGQTYPAQYFAMNGYVPTPYVFNVAQGQFWQPGVGYADYLPPTYQSPITVSVQEVVPTFNSSNAITGYQPQTFYYNAFWDNNAQSFGYYDYRKKFHWLTFPWLKSYSQQYVEH